MKLSYDKMLSNFAFNCNMRPYTWVWMGYSAGLPTRIEVGQCRCSLTPG